MNSKLHSDNRIFHLFRGTFVVYAAVVLTFIFIIFSASETAGKSGTKENWVGTWSTAPQLVEPRNMPPEPGLSHNTIRQIVHVSIGGDSLRMRFSNEFGTSPLTLNEVHIALQTDSSSIDPNTDKAVGFGGKAGVTIEPGTAITSDPLQFSFKPMSNITVTIYFGDTSPEVTGHPGSRTTSYLLTGNMVSAADFKNAIGTDHWYIINNIEVKAPDSTAAVVILGNSITDGRGSGTNKQDRWPDELSKRLQKNKVTSQVAVLNEGIGGNCVLHNCLGPSAISRFKHDVIEQKGVRWLIILEGINDIGQAHGAQGSAKVAADLISAFKDMIDSAHAKGIRVYGATLLPMGGSFYYTPEHESARDTVNKWIRSSGSFDAVIDFDEALRDPSDPIHLLPEADSGDHLHPSEAGHRMMAEAVDLTLFK